MNIIVQNHLVYDLHVSSGLLHLLLFILFIGLLFYLLRFLLLHLLHLLRLQPNSLLPNIHNERQRRGQLPQSHAFPCRHLLQPELLQVCSLISNLNSIYSYAII